MKRLFKSLRIGLLGALGCIFFLSHGLQLVNAQVQESLQLKMPMGYRLPMITDPLPDPANVTTRDRVGLSFHGRDLAVHRLHLDTTPLYWADDLLTLVVGIPGETQGWTPTNRYQVHPVGPPGHQHDQRAMALLGDELVIFVAPLRGQPPQPYPSVNVVGYTIALSGHDIVITKEHKRRWFFQTRDFGATWHLDRMEMLNRPGQFISLIYDENARLSALNLPNGRKYELAYTQDQVTAIRDPFSSETQIKYDPAGLISQIDQFTSDAPDGRARFRTASYSYTYDAQQRLSTFLDDRRMQWSCSYLQEVSDNKRSPVNSTYTTRITSTEGEYLFQQIESRRNGDYARITGSGDRRTTIQAAVAQYQFAQKIVAPWGVNLPGKGPKPKRASRSSQSGLMDASEDNQEKSGLTSWLNDGWPRSLDDYRYTMFYLPWPREGEPDSKENQKAFAAPRLMYDSAGRVVKADHFNLGGEKTDQANSSSRPSFNSVSKETPNVISTFHYSYTQQGNLAEATLEDQKRPHIFTTDIWGRIIKHQRPDESYTQWVFDDLGRLIEIQVAIPLAKDPKDLFAETRFQNTSTRFSYDQFGRLLRRTTDGQPEERLIYNPAGQLISYQAGGPATQVRYRYDRLGSLIQQDQANGNREEYAYFTDGRLSRHDRRPKNDRWVLREFDPQGNVIVENIESMGRTQYEYDDLSRQTRIIHPNGKDTRYTYDELNRVVTIRGSAQPPADIRYGKDGQRIITTPQ